jgi:hypothetical protein
MQQPAQGLLLFYRMEPGEEKRRFIVAETSDPQASGEASEDARR